jgi:hypothetical protein
MYEYVDFNYFNIDEYGSILNFNNLNKQDFINFLKETKTNKVPIIVLDYIFNEINLRELDKSKLTTDDIKRILRKFNLKQYYDDAQYILNVFLHKNRSF